MTLIEKAKAIRKLIEKAAASLDTADALAGVELFPTWKSETSYTRGQRIRHNGVLYTVLQDHISQISWPPDTAISLFAKVLIPDENKIPEWEQPGATNPYKKGDTVIFGGTTYRSLIDGNVWSPAAYPAGWEVIS